MLVRKNQVFLKNYKKKYIFQNIKNSSKNTKKVTLNCVFFLDKGQNRDAGKKKLSFFEKL